MNKADNKKYVIAKESDGTIQITFTIDWDTISKNQAKALEELGKDVEVPGFRKGNAPSEKVKQNVSKEKLVEKTLSGILPKMLSDALVNEKIKPSIFPKFELEKADDNEDWQVRAILCEIQPFKLGEYKTKIKELLNQPKIWTPSSGKPEEKNKELTRSEKEQKIIEFLLGSVELTVPKILINEEVNNRLSQLLAQIEKLGLTLDGYLSSVGKNAQIVRDEYAKQAEDTLKIELILERISIEEKLNVTEAEVDEAVKASSSDPKVQENLNSAEQRNLIKVILMRRKALDYMLSLT